MSYIDNKRFKEILEAKRNGNEKAIAIISKYMQGGTQDELNRLVDDYYATPVQGEDIVPPMPEANPEEAEAPVSIGDHQDMVPVEQALEESVPDLYETLDGELDGIIDVPEIQDSTFEEFLANKRRDQSRLRKNRDYFGAFDPQGREEYIKRKKGEFSDSFSTRRSDIDRQFRDMDGAIDMYSQYVTDGPDDEVEFNADVVDKAYGDIIDYGKKSHSFGRGWDDGDLSSVKEKLAELIKGYGKANVVAALNALKGDNMHFRDHRINQIDKGISDYGNALDKLLK